MDYLWMLAHTEVLACLLEVNPRPSHLCSVGSAAWPVARSAGAATGLLISLKAFFLLFLGLSVSSAVCCGSSSASSDLFWSPEQSKLAHPQLQ